MKSQRKNVVSRQPSNRMSLGSSSGPSLGVYLFGNMARLSCLRAMTDCVSVPAGSASSNSRADPRPESRAQTLGAASLAGSAYSRGTRCYAVAAIRPVCCCLESKSADAARGERGKTLLRRNIAGADFQAEYEGSIPFTRSKQSDALRSLLLLNTSQIIDNGEDACSHDDFRASLRPGQFPIRRINIVRQADDGVESFPPNRHFPSAVSGNCFRSVYGFIESVRGKNPVVVLGQHRQIGSRYLELVADRSFAPGIRTVTTRARRLKF